MILRLAKYEAQLIRTSLLSSSNLKRQITGDLDTKIFIQKLSRRVHARGCGGMHDITGCDSLHLSYELMLRTVKSCDSSEISHYIEMH